MRFHAGLFKLGFPDFPERDSGGSFTNLIHNSNLNVFPAKARNELDYFRIARHSTKTVKELRLNREAVRLRR